MIIIRDKRFSTRKTASFTATSFCSSALGDISGLLKWLSVHAALTSAPPLRIQPVVARLCFDGYRKSLPNLNEIWRLPNKAWRKYA